MSTLALNVVLFPPGSSCTYALPAACDYLCVSRVKIYKRYLGFLGLVTIRMALISKTLTSTRTRAGVLRRRNDSMVTDINPKPTRTCCPGAPTFGMHPLPLGFLRGYPPSLTPSLSPSLPSSACLFPSHSHSFPPSSLPRFPIELKQNNTVGIYELLYIGRQNV